ncbi:hypothetical protein K3X41_09865 [Aliiroseovarius crassostreae]|uniref:hypothetical protein n=1 Tax=Aliiroseovarius crassostreae TaxID=154981 RepID=UPI0021F9FA6A|nr:hypothetical protein [Aliiroseovarius crassostreae]UWQ07123.1 hypothetical protein K3X25_09995 [Aliiroseovarius crassostreae]UWQ10231.1 hypothetical protein K3X41_09865 [Aliiroseovarius crassostreae]
MQLIWPEDKREATTKFVLFAVDAVKDCGFEFGECGPDPVGTAIGYATGSIDEMHYTDAATKWWEYLEDRNWLQNFIDEEALMARLALCLLSARLDEYERLDMHVEWVFEVLEMLGCELVKPQEMLTHHFG